MYLGNFESFRFTATADTAFNSIVKAGELIGVTKANTLNGEIGMAFLGVPVSVYSFTVTALDANKTQGTAVYIDGDGAITFSASDGASPATAYDKIGVLWEAANSGATEIKVALR
ncbi:MAG: DUF2190 family protein [Thermoguttaceae bacterium]|nr:DUF2190 family protein [Thermoguttaceae bacterium]